MEEITNQPENQSQQGSSNVGETERWASLIGGGALVLMGLKQRSLRGALLAVAGGGLVYQGVNKKSTIHQAQEAIGMNQSIKVEKKPKS